MRMKAILPIFFVAAALAAAAFAQTTDPLAESFKNPPDAAKPRTWWHWTQSNVTKDGITKDLEWMKRVGIGGFMLADVSAGGGQNVETKTPFGTPEWFDAVRHAAAEADRLGLEMSIFSSPGWSETGGPWVKPEQAMKKYVWSETLVEGGKKFSGRLNQPPNNIGQIRNTGAGYYTSDSKEPPFYADAAVVAYRTPAGEQDAAAAKPVVTMNGAVIDGTPLLDDQLGTLLTIPAPKDGGPAWVQFEFPAPFFARAITLGGQGGSARGIPVGRVLASDDGKSWRALVTLPGTQLYRQGMVRTYAFAPTTAKFYRLELTGAPIGPAPTMSQAPSAPAQQYVLSEAVLHSGARVQRWEEKAGFSFLFEYDSVPTPDVPAAATVSARDVIDLTAKMKPDGSLEWDAPAGTWTVLRLGYSLTGAKNRPATAAGSGYEADKLSRRHMEAYYHGYFDPLAKALGPLFGKSLRYVMMDSWEAGTNNWTDEIAAEFKKRRGYDPTPYLPVLTGRIVENAEVSDRFLWDFRRTLADLWADAHYGMFAEKLREKGIGIYAEAAGVSLEMPEDTLLNKSKVEIPMGEFWVRDLHPRLMYLQDVRGAASASHVYGKPLTAAESFTGGGYESPFTLKKVADYWLAQGINRLVFHTSAHQPLDTKPGNTMVGTHLNRNITWAEQAAPFFTYLARQCQMLQQGKFVADLAYLLNEGAPSTPPIWAGGTRPTPPEGFDFDFINADVLLNRMSVADDGRLVVSSAEPRVLPDGSTTLTAGGMSYRALVLPETDRMRPELVKKIGELARGGALLIGPKPTRSPSLDRYPACDDEVRTLAADLWGDLDGESRTIRYVGKGRVVWGWSPAEALAAAKIPKDFDYARGLDADLAWLHRRTADADIYYVANTTDRAQNFDARFRVAGRAAELFHPDTGAIEPTDYTITGDRTVIPLHLAERESVFVVFRGNAPAPSRMTTPAASSTIATLDGAWSVAFPEKLGAPASVQLAKLESLSTHADAGVKYFSGTATYTKTINPPREWFRPGATTLLDLGRVGDIAEITINGRALGQLWKPPYRLDVTAALKPGENKLEIKVTNQWTNRIAGDRAAPADQKILAAAPPGRGGGGGGGATPALPDSGLIGPVTISLSQ
ncbi:MAG: glycoside hydrolase [Verrucomicrobia bacterium]|nr:glycoside hydrolase [Verrucomicrobiota bacterium]